LKAGRGKESLTGSLKETYHLRRIREKGIKNRTPAAERYLTNRFGKGMASAVPSMINKYQGFSPWGPLALSRADTYYEVNSGDSGGSPIGGVLLAPDP
jgi:hypothetical protein